MWFKAALVIGLCSLFVYKVNAINNSIISLPCEVEETLLDLLNKTELDNLDTSNRSIVPVYRKDLDPNYVAYYEINLQGNQFLLLSAGPKTGDYKEAQSGPPPLPTKVLKDQSKKAGQVCSKFYLLGSIGLYMCENVEGRAVAATYNWTVDAPVTDWTTLQKMVVDSLNDFKSSWEKVATSSKEHWKTSCQRIQANEKLSLETFNTKIVSPGSKAEVALEDNYENINIHAIPASRQGELCAILEDVCTNQSVNVNQDLIRTTKSGIKYLEFQVKNDTNYVIQILKNKEISFYFQIEKKDGQQLLMYFSVVLS